MGAGVAMGIPIGAMLGDMPWQPPGPTALSPCIRNSPASTENSSGIRHLPVIPAMAVRLPHPATAYTAYRYRVAATVHDYHAGGRRKRWVRSRTRYGSPDR